MTALWLRLRNERNASNNGTYVNLSNGNRLGVREYSYLGSRWEVWHKAPNQNAETLADGYLSENEALAALDDFMSSQDVAQLQPPMTDEERADAERDAAEQAALEAERVNDEKEMEVK